MTLLNKPVVRKTRPHDLPHGVADEIVVTLYPGGVIGLRELRRRKEYRLDAGVLYVAAMVKEAAVARAEKRGRR